MNLTSPSSSYFQTKELLASDDHVYSVVRVLHVLVKSPFDELVSGAYLILMQLAVTVQLQPDLWNEVILLLVKVRAHCRRKQSRGCKHLSPATHFVCFALY